MPWLLVVSIEALMKRLITPRELEQKLLRIETGDSIDRDALILSLVESGFQRAGVVEERGSFAVRGGVIDCFPPGGDFPIRFDLFGDTIEAIKRFDPLSQRSIETLSEIRIIPVTETIVSPATIEAVVPAIRKLASELNLPRARWASLVDAIQRGEVFPGIESYQPLFLPRSATLFDFLPPEAVIWIHDEIGCRTIAARLEKTLHDRHARGVGEGLPYPATDSLFLSASDLLTQLSARNPMRTAPDLIDGGIPANLHPLSLGTTGWQTLADQCREAKDAGHLLSDTIKTLQAEGYRVQLFTGSASQHEQVADLLAPYGVSIPESHVTDITQLLPGTLSSFAGHLSKGFLLAGEQIALISLDELFQKRHRTSRRSRSPDGEWINTLGELIPGTLVVHRDHGIGRYLGMRQMTVSGVETDTLEIEYRHSDRLFLSVQRLNTLQRYIGPEKDDAQLDQLGGESWEKKKAKVKRAIEEMAEELIELYAVRKVRKGFQHTPPDQLFREFEATFPFDETDDQRRAIDDTLADMCQPVPMDRLVCGDVGYGKTEVAIRAAFKSVLDGKQVAVLCPTTILAQQHLNTFSSRFHGYPIDIAMLSRFVSPREQKATLHQVAAGRVDILIGTHRILSKDVTFADLGLLVVDEEQRFGVGHKERIKQMKESIDVLTLTATPIPRTLQMAMSGIREISIIHTPPADRRSIQTFVGRFNENLIKDAVQRELDRNGQIFFVHNRIQSLPRIEHLLRDLFPKIRLAIAHGQQHEQALEQVMLDFVAGKTDVLISTAIVENGLDIPNANTLILTGVQMFGLGQLYQLRGRVGRSSKQAYAYFLIDDDQRVSDDTKKRLSVLKEFSDLGSGFQIAIHDLEIRGAGNLLGHSQSGNVASVGIETYTEMVEAAIRKAKGEAFVEPLDPEIRVDWPTGIPNAYLDDTQQRLTIYRRISRLQSEKELLELRTMLLDRFGPLPAETENLLCLMKLRFVAIVLGAEQLQVSPTSIALTISRRATVATEAVIKLIQTDRTVRLSSDRSLILDGPFGDLEKAYERMIRLQTTLAPV